MISWLSFTTWYCGKLAKNLASRAAAGPKSCSYGRRMPGPKSPLVSSHRSFFQKIQMTHGWNLVVSQITLETDVFSMNPFKTGSGTNEDEQTRGTMVDVYPTNITWKMYLSLSMYISTSGHVSKMSISSYLINKNHVHSFSGFWTQRKRRFSMF